MVFYTEATTCIVSCTNCGHDAVSVSSGDKWQCQWNRFRLVVDSRGRMQVHTHCNGTSRPSVLRNCKWLNQCVIYELSKN